MCATELLHFPLREVRMDLNLVDRRHHLVAIEQSREMFGQSGKHPSDGIATPLLRVLVSI
jgi:hypothetical protein